MDEEATTAFTAGSSAHQRALAVVPLVEAALTSHEVLEVARIYTYLIGLSFFYVVKIPPKLSGSKRYFYVRGAHNFFFSNKLKWSKASMAPLY